MPALQSNILDLVRTQQEQSVRVAEACKAAADARADGADLEHMLAWLTGAHAQEMALHQAFQSEVGLDWWYSLGGRLPHTCWLPCDPGLPWPLWPLCSGGCPSLRSMPGTLWVGDRAGQSMARLLSWLSSCDTNAWHITG